MVHVDLQRHWKMCQALRHNSTQLAQKSAGDYFDLRKKMRVTGVEKKALRFIRVREQPADVR